MRDIKYYCGVLLCFFIDFLSKCIAFNFLEEDKEYFLNKYISIERINNNSNIMAFFSFEDNLNIFRFCWIFSAFLILSLIIWVNNQKIINDNVDNNLIKCGLFLLLSGGLGNLFDKIFRQGNVIDFLRINFSEDMILILNFADIVLYLGLILLFSGIIKILKNQGLGLVTVS